MYRLWRRNTEVRVTLNFPADLVSTYLFLSETDAQAVALKLRQQAPLGTVMTTLMPHVDRGVTRPTRVWIH